MAMAPQAYPLFVRSTNATLADDPRPVVGWVWNETVGGYDPVVLHPSGQARVMRPADLGNKPRFYANADGAGVIS